MGVFQAAVLGIIQGVTEFLPISSDGHLALGFMLFDLKFNLDYVVFLHFATLLAIVTYFWRDVVRLLAALLPANRHRVADRRLVALIAVGTAVTGVVALALEPLIESASESQPAIAAGFLFTSAIMAVGEILSARARTAEAAKAVAVDNAGEDEVEHAAAALPWLRSLGIAFAQGLAVLPGVSRSGSTTATGMLAGLSREDAARYSFLLGIPIISLAAAKDALDLIGGTGTLPGAPQLIAGFLAAGLSGYVAIWGLLKLVRNHSLLWFSAYTALAGILLLANTFIRL